MSAAAAISSSAEASLSDLHPLLLSASPSTAARARNEWLKRVAQEEKGGIRRSLMHFSRHAAAVGTSIAFLFRPTSAAADGERNMEGLTSATGALHAQPLRQIDWGRRTALSLEDCSSSGSHVFALILPVPQATLSPRWWEGLDARTKCPFANVARGDDPSLCGFIAAVHASWPALQAESAGAFLTAALPLLLQQLAEASDELSHHSRKASPLAATSVIRHRQGWRSMTARKGVAVSSTVCKPSKSCCRLLVHPLSSHRFPATFLPLSNTCVPR